MLVTECHPQTGMLQSIRHIARGQYSPEAAPRRNLRASADALIYIRRIGQTRSGKMSRAVIVMVSELSGVSTSDRAHTM